MKLASKHQRIAESAAFGWERRIRACIAFPFGADRIKAIAKFGTADTVIRRQSVGFEPKIGWYRGVLVASRPELDGRFFFC